MHASRLHPSIFALLLAIVPTLCALNTTSGMGRYIDTINPYNTQFSDLALTDSFESILSTLISGPNRTQPFPTGLDKIYGVNIGNWLIFEPWMAPGEWKSMGGEYCGDCSKCIQSEWQLANSLSQDQTNKVFQKHWESWFTQADVDAIVSFNLNTVRIPLGFWIVEGIVHRDVEPYAEGGLIELVRGLNMLREAGIAVILDQHALPGVSASNQMFAGNCTTRVNFYKDAEYQRAVTWGTVMTYLAHIHPAFSSVFAIEAINEPIQNYASTPNLDHYEKSFVLAVRMVELALGIICDPTVPDEALSDSITMAALEAAAPIILDVSKQLGLEAPFSAGQNPFSGTAGTLRSSELSQDKCIATNFMNRDWQYSKNPSQQIPNPADYAKGPQIYDNHLYFNFGGVSAPDAHSYLTTICKLQTSQKAASINDIPLFFGEWSIATNFEADDDFLRQWGDAQKLVYGGTSIGWIFWNFKVDSDADAVQNQWSYENAVNVGILPKDARTLFDENVCSNYS